MKNLEALKKWIDTIIKLGPFIIVFEVIIGAIMAIASSQIKAIDSLWFGILIFSIIVFTAINIFKYFNEKNFPKLLIENIENEINEDTLSKSFARKSLINDAIASTLIGLNDQTCKLTNKAVPNYATEEEISNRMCEKDIEDGVLNLLRPFITNLHLVLESFNSKFTVATYLQNIASETPKQDIVEYNTGIYVLKDELKIKESLIWDLLERTDLKSEKQEIQNILRLSINNNRFENGKFKINGEEYYLLSSTIPIVCDDDHPDGLFIVIGKDLGNVPNDIEEIFRIFNRVLANWISKYNECVYSRINYKE
ncbi:hypothetical protein P700755_000200 [Psychroflexus torquis ATCC 700755]|uniref:Uncharacterized protein n=1 Tax=Psychroflexus torquis (strain ATCC 700755 / CIP 106069 / ACAM 623) TaxID=313595 RepID=K4IA04_PSYTT|nr:hypothetical protein [Psychroflexus torquis]AFU67254.1 hypothetical protein P700755_000200 [Psychroflexus torquis ATCC 700755]